MQHLAHSLSSPAQDTTDIRVSPAGTKHVTMLRAQAHAATRARSNRMASVSLDRATASSQQRQSQPQVKAAPTSSRSSSRRTRTLEAFRDDRPMINPLQRQSTNSMGRHTYRSQSTRGGSASPYSPSRPATPNTSKADRPVWQHVTRAPVKHRTTDGVGLQRYKLLTRSPAVGPRADRASVDAQKLPLRQSAESLEARNNKGAVRSRQPNTSSTRWPRQPAKIESAGCQVIRERVQQLRSKSRCSEDTKPALRSKSQRSVNTERGAQECRYTVRAQSPIQHAAKGRESAHNSNPRKSGARRASASSSVLFRCKSMTDDYEL
jgi:hypothetical protein